MEADFYGWRAKNEFVPLIIYISSRAFMYKQKIVLKCNVGVTLYFCQLSVRDFYGSDISTAPYKKKRGFEDLITWDQSSEMVHVYTGVFVHVRDHPINPSIA